ncbi:unnamed protein product [Paramecium pentaurelia]|uniref:CUE domain-containing protein n=1 Tax=Paramecium pentaurelia TaxID=43138 RepID=A0A8S1X3F8_9CILI|nr:unnamed protein product [Paramecium pentaurelia]
MSNIKYIYLKKIHKVPSNITNYYNLIETIKNTNKQLKNIYLFAIINPEKPDILTEINSDVTFQQLKIVYQQQGLPSIKLLVTETQNYQEILKDCQDFLNQSIVTTEKKYQDVSTFFQPSNQDQWQQFSPLLGNIGTQAQVQKIDKAQNTNEMDFRNNQQLKELIDEIIDQKLKKQFLIDQKPKELGLITNNNNQIDPSDYRFRLTMKSLVYIAIPNNNLNVKLILKNNGKKKWYNPYIINKEINFLQKFIDLSPDQSIEINISIPFIPQHFNENQKHFYSFKINVENEQRQQFEVNGQIPILVQAPIDIQQSQQEQKISKLLDIFPQKGKNYITKFVQENDQDKSVDQLIEELLQ